MSCVIRKYMSVWACLFCTEKLSWRSCAHEGLTHVLCFGAVHYLLVLFLGRRWWNFPSRVVDASRSPASCTTVYTNR